MRRISGFILAVLLAVAVPSYAVTYSFENITNNNPVNAAIGEAQLTVDVTNPAGANNVLFTFNNTGPFAASITDIYFDDGTLLAISTITDSGVGVAFSQGATPGNLPGGLSMSPVFVTTAGFSADSDAPVAFNGVNPGQWVSILFTLQSGQEYATVLSSLSSGALRIGIHVQAIGPTEGSESFVNNITPVPEPDIYAMLAAGLGLMGFVARRRKQQGAVV